jgi:lipopolysaccharide/colanic/teichoic acid biosynthesis glycosyltransferase
MSLSPLIIDRRPAYLGGTKSAASLLTLPAGCGSVLDHLLSCLDGSADGRALVVPSFETDPSYEEAVRDCTSSSSVAVQVCPQPRLASVLEKCEPGDYLLVIDAGRWFMGDGTLGAIARLSPGYRGATHVIAIGADRSSAREHVECGPNDQVRRVVRLYNEMTWPKTAGTTIVASLVPARAIRDVTFTSLGELRSVLSGRGVLSRDVPLESELIDLTDARGLLALHGKLTQDAVAQSVPEGFCMRSPGVLVGDGCTVDPSARLVGPVVIRRGARLAAKVTIIGPAVVGSDSRIEDGAVVIRSVVADGASVAGASTVWQRVVAGDSAVAGASAGDRARLPDASPAPAFPDLPDEPNASRMQEGADAARHRRVDCLLKRVFDIVMVCIALVLLAPMLIVVAILIKVDSRGPVLFTHYRERKGGKEFPCWKFRTMVRDAHTRQRELYQKNEVDGPQFKMRDDPRVTRVGQWLRATNIDELPQLFNVLLGHMSLVGPRPSPFRENQICVPWRRARLSVRPGVTGLWQLCRDKRTEGDFHQWIYYDLAYVRHFSFWLDLKIILATVLTLAGRWRVPISWLIPSSRLDGGSTYRVGDLSFAFQS